MTDGLRLAIAAGALAAAFAAGWTVNGWRLAGQLEALSGVVETQKQSIATLEGANRRCVAGLEDVRGAVQGFIADAEARARRAEEAMRKAAAAAQQHLQAARDALDRPVPQAGEECDVAAREAAQYAQRRRAGQ